MAILFPAGEHQTSFNEFYQVSATTGSVKEGTGRGLVIIKLLVEFSGRRHPLGHPGNG